MAIKVNKVTRNMKVNIQRKDINVHNVTHNYTVNKKPINITATSSSHPITVRNITTAISINNIARSIQVHSVGRRGPQGIQGLPGSGGDKNYRLDFTNSSQLTINHNLSKYPAVTVTDSAGDEIEGQIEHIDLNQLVASFSASFTGRIVCN